MPNAHEFISLIKKVRVQIPILSLSNYQKNKGKIKEIKTFSSCRYDFKIVLTSSLAKLKHYQIVLFQYWGRWTKIRSTY